MVRVFHHGTIELKGDEGASFKVNGLRVIHFIGTVEEMRSCNKVNLDEV